MSTTGESTDLYIASLRARHVPTNTIKAYTHDLRHFVATVPTDLDQVTAPVIQEFLDTSNRAILPLAPSFEAIPAMEDRHFPSPIPLFIKLGKNIVEKLQLREQSTSSAIVAQRN